VQMAIPAGPVTQASKDFGTSMSNFISIAFENSQRDPETTSSAEALCRSSSSGLLRWRCRGVAASITSGYDIGGEKAV
jgi:hypothetical protein